MNVKTRLSPQEQLRIFIEGLKDNVKIADTFHISIDKIIERKIAKGK